MECNNHNLQYVKRIKSNNTTCVQKQCLSCGEANGKFYKITEIGGKENLDKLPLYDSKLNNLYYENRYLKQKLDWLKKNNDYYNSEAWKNKRLQVLQRDNYICQCCLNNKATQVHHISYKHFGDEYLFELTSICNNCHEELTDKDRMIDKYTSFNLVIGSRFKAQGRTFIVVGMTWQAKRLLGYQIREEFQEPEPTEVFERTYEYMENLINTKKITLL